jgi:hypothetical protein
VVRKINTMAQIIIEKNLKMLNFKTRKKAKEENTKKERIKY